MKPQNMVDRRGFLALTTGTITGVLVAGSPLAALAPSRAWAVELNALTDAEGAALLAMTRTIAPHDRLEDAAYALVVGALDADAARDAAVLREHCAPGSPRWAPDSPAPMRPAASLRCKRSNRRRSSRACAARRCRCFTQPMAYALFGYEGEAFSKGGYLLRGFNDLQWLPEVPLEASGPLPAEARG